MQINKLLHTGIMIAALAAIAACTSKDPIEGGGNIDPFTPGGGGGSQDGSVSGLDVSFDTNALTETDIVPTDPNSDDYDDYVENTTWKNFYTITYSEGKASVYSDNPDSAITITTDGAHVTVNATKKAQYVLKGQASDGSFKIYSDSKFEVNLDGLSLTNPDGAAINSQSKKRFFLTCTAGTSNSLCDGETYTACGEEDQKGTLFSEGQIIFSGEGTLSVTAKGKNAIASDQYIRIRKNTNIQVSAGGSNGIKADDITIDGGVQNISVTAAGGKGLKAENSVTVNGGRTIIINTASVEYTSSSSQTGGGGWNRPGGGGSSSSSSMPKGIKADTLITINGGDIRVQCNNGEGIESKITLDVNGGDIFSYCGDDAINTGGKITVNGGRVYAFSTGNDAIDSNYGRSGAFTITGGLVVGLTTKGGVEEGIDCDNNSYIIIKGGYVFSAGGQQGGGGGPGGSSSSGSIGSASQGYILTSGTFSANRYYTLADGDSKNIYTFLLPAGISSSLSLISAPEMQKGSAYTVKSGTSAPTDAQSSFRGFYLGSSLVGSDNCLSFTAK